MFCSMKKIVNYSNVKLPLQRQSYTILIYKTDGWSCHWQSLFLEHKSKFQLALNIMCTDLLMQTGEREEEVLMVVLEDIILRSGCWWLPEPTPELNKEQSSDWRWLLDAFSGQIPGKLNCSSPNLGLLWVEIN